MQTILRTLKTNKWADPVLWGFVIVLAAAYFLSPNLSTGWWPTLLLILGVVLASILVFFLTRKVIHRQSEIVQPTWEFGIVAGWYTCYFVLSMVLKGGGILANDPAKWLWFVILPVFLLWIVRRKQNANFISLLRSVGLHRQGLGRALLIGLVVYAILLPCSLFSMPDSQIDKLMTILQEPLKAALVFPLCLVFALVLPGFTEEIFFRGILQSRLAEFMNSDIRSLLITSFLFGIYHLPYAFFYDSWPTFGNWGWSITSVITEQMVAGLILGVLWMRTRNLFACVLVHGLIDVLPMAANLNITIG